jgi:hypothetical protein
MSAGSPRGSLPADTGLAVSRQDDHNAAVCCPGGEAARFGGSMKNGLRSRLASALGTRMRGNFRMRDGSVLALIALLVLLQGCSLGPKAPHKEIDAIGVVASETVATVGDDIVDTYTFDDGRTYSMRFNTNKGIQGNGDPRAGDLLIAGSRPDNWVLVARPQDTASGFPPGCYGLGLLAGYDRETTVELDFGVTLQKAPDYDPTGHVALAHFGDLGFICLDRQGRVTLINA